MRAGESGAGGEEGARVGVRRLEGQEQGADGLDTRGPEEVPALRLRAEGPLEIVQDEQDGTGGVVAEGGGGKGLHDF